MSRLTAALCVIALACVTPKIAGAVDTDSSSHRISIPSLPLASALQELAKQSGIQIVFLSSVAEGRDAPALNGTFTAEAALGTLLNGSGLTFRPLNDRTLQVFVQTEPVAVAVSEVQGSDRLSEVEIRAEREKLWRMRAEMRTLEDQFFEQYNAINTADELDIRCNLEPGQRIRFGDTRRICQPAFGEKAATLCSGGGGGGSADAGLLGLGGSLAGSAVGPACWPLFMHQTSKWAAYEKHMLELINRYPQLRKIVSDREALQKRYDEVRQGMLKGRLFILE
jgi:hypothetical protein